MREGDKNTTFFHRIASGRRDRNWIEAIVDGSGMVQKEEADIRGVFTDYFSGLFTAKVP